MKIIIPLGDFSSFIYKNIRQKNIKNKNIYIYTRVLLSVVGTYTLLFTLSPTQSLLLPTFKSAP